jgi:hypothetical protein
MYTGDVQHNVQWRRYLSGRLEGKRWSHALLSLH